MAEKRSKHPGIEVRHSRTCPAAGGGGRCSCTPTYRVKVYSARDGRTMLRHGAVRGGGDAAVLNDAPAPAPEAIKLVRPWNERDRLLPPRTESVPSTRDRWQGAGHGGQGGRRGVARAVLAET